VNILAGLEIIKSCLNISDEDATCRAKAGKSQSGCMLAMAEACSESNPVQRIQGIADGGCTAIALMAAALAATPSQKPRLRA
jgi:hypothetical protein